MIFSNPATSLLLAIFVNSDLLSVKALDVSTLTISDSVLPGIASRVTEWYDQAPASNIPFTVTITNTNDSPNDESYSIKSFPCSDDDSSPVDIIVSGSQHGAYALLELIGVTFMHPLEPTIFKSSPVTRETICDLNINTSPHWPERGWHYNTLHPLELTEVLNGLDAMDSPLKGEIETFESMLPQVDLFFQWCIANGQNYVQWVLLNDKNWEDGFVDGYLRKERLKVITDMAHDVGLRASADVTIALKQQHSWHMINSARDKNWQEQIDGRLDWLFNGAGFDMLGTESGTTEFTHPSCETMVGWMNYTAMLCDEKYVGRASEP